MLVEISYDPDVSRIGTVVDLPDDEARVKIHEGRARRVVDAEPGPVADTVITPQTSGTETGGVEVKGPDPAEHPEPAGPRPDDSGATDEVTVQLDQGATDKPGQDEPDQDGADKPAPKRRARAS